MKALRRIKWKWIFATGLALVVLVLIWVYKIDRDIQQRLESGWFESPIEFYSEAEPIRVGQALSPKEFESWLFSWGFQNAPPSGRILPEQYQIFDDVQCAEVAGSPFLENTSRCILFRNKSDEFKLIAFSESDQVSLLFEGDPLVERNQIRTSPKLYAQFLGDQAILRTLLQLGEVPLQCLQSVTAAEDSDFLDHKGISPTGLARAIFKNLTAGRYAQGGSTITQQLVKNYFLTPEKTIQRKFKELIMAVLLELRASKDQILQSYLNVIYMGQNGPFQIMGLKSASDFYFNKPLGRLNLSECALIAAIINSPGRFSPGANPAAARTRRDFVLSRMRELNLIDADQMVEAQSRPLPVKPKTRLGEPAAYFTQASFRELQELGVSLPSGGKVFTSMNERLQDLAQKHTEKHVAELENGLATLKKLKADGKNLEASLISVDQKTGAIRALVGGRKYTKTQFNRVLDAKRQVGSLMKPFVVLAALNSDQDPRIDANTLIDDAAFTHKYDGQSWSPKNYDRQFRGPVPLYVALKDSLNIPFVKLGLQVGLDEVVETAKDLGVTSPMDPFPSLTLGAFEIRPIELAQSFATIANFGLYRRLHSVLRVENHQGDVLYEYNSEPELKSPPTTTAVLVGMMKQTIDAGTGSYARRAGFVLPAAGKTGTTSDTKDTWFVGFTPELLTLTWTGYDDNTPTGLTGATGALPLWTRYNLEALKSNVANDFEWPEGTTTKDGLIFVEE